MTATDASATHTLAATWWLPANVKGATGSLVAHWRCSCGVTGAVSEGKSPKAKMAAAHAEYAEHAKEAPATEEAPTPEPTEIVYHFPVPKNDADRRVTNGALTVFAYDLEVAIWHSPLGPTSIVARLKGQVIRKADGLLSSRSRILGWSRGGRAPFLRPIADAPQWVREAYEFVEAQA